MTIDGLRAKPGECVCGHPFEGSHRTPGTECAEKDCDCSRFQAKPGESLFSAPSGRSLDAIHITGAAWVTEEEIDWLIRTLLLLIETVQETNEKVEGCKYPVQHLAIDLEWIAQWLREERA